MTDNSLLLSSQPEKDASKEAPAPSASALRSGAEIAISKGKHDEALRLFAQVCVMCVKKRYG